MTATPAPSTDTEQALAALGTTAPEGFASAVLARVGLADRYATIDSPLGPLFIAWNDVGVSAVALADDATGFETRHRSRTGRPVTRTDRLPERLARAIDRRLSGAARADVPLDLRGTTAFEQAVWRKALEIPSGEVRPYGWIAAEIGRPRAVRAVGTALGHNPVPLIVPCHRVVRTDGSIGQYSLGGQSNKRAILAAEGLDPEALEALAQAGVRYIGSDTTNIVCLPTCRAARRISTQHRVHFRSLESAAAQGFRPCMLCRPAGAAAA